MEEVYNLEDALVVASFLMSFIRHADSVKIANLAQIVNVIAPILTEGDTMVLQTSYHAFRMISQRKTGVALKASQRGPSVETSTYGDVPVIDSAVILDRDRSRLHLFAMNRDIDQASEIRLQMPGYSPVLESAEILHGELSATNTFSDPTRIRAEPFDGWAGNTVELPPHSFVVSTFALDGSSVNEE
jgi:alpha-N-arabinofuranosidase